MSLLTDGAGHDIGYITFDLVSGVTSDPVIVWADPNVEGAMLQSGTSAIGRLKARRTGTADPYVFLDTPGIDLSTDAPDLTSFDLICVAQSVSGLERDAIFVGVTHSGSAGWTS